MDILIYNGDGTERVNVLYHSLVTLLSILGISKKYDVRTIKPEILYSKDWLNKTKLLIIPGGRDLPYVRDLKGDSLENIKIFIELGGSYLGLCAGAYFSCGYVLFEEGTPMEVIGSRDLDLFHGTAKGSVYHPFVYNSTAGARTVPLFCDDKELGCSGKMYAYFNGGCEFLSDDGFSDYISLAYYMDYPMKKAIIRRELGKGKIILSGVHPEMDHLYMKSSEYSKEQWESMVAHGSEQRRLFQLIIEYLLGTRRIFHKL